MFCNKCGNEIHDDAVICVHCGCAIAGKSIGNKKKAGVNVINIVQLILALLCGVLAFLPEAIKRSLYEVGFFSQTDYISILEATDGPSGSELATFGIILIIALCACFIYRIVALCVRPASEKPIRVTSIIVSLVTMLLGIIFAVVADSHVYETYDYVYYGSSSLRIPVEYRYSTGITAAILLVALLAMVILDIVNLVKSKKTR